ncbi:Sec-independent protein translocase subunit TatA [Kitasatospora gansuensis]
MLRNGFEPWHLLVVLAVIILLFGSKKLPDMARGLGKSMRILKAETKALREDDAPAAGTAAPADGTAQSTATEQPRPRSPRPPSPRRPRPPRRPTRPDPSGRVLPGRRSVHVTGRRPESFPGAGGWRA